MEKIGELRVGGPLLFFILFVRLFDDLTKFFFFIFRIVVHQQNSIGNVRSSFLRFFKGERREKWGAILKSQ